MLIEHGRHGIRFDTDVEGWMADLQFTEVFNFSTEPVGQDEQEITRVLDGILYEVIFGERMDEVITRLQGQGFKLIRGKAKKGEQQFNTAMGNAVDHVFRACVQREKTNGKLQSYGARLSITPAGAMGPDTYMQGSPMTAWDVTTRAAAADHVVRDNFRRGWSRYYLLIWDEPGTGFNVGGEIRRLSRLL